MNPIASVVQLISEGLDPKAPKSSGPLTLVPLYGGLTAKEYIVGADAFADGTLTITEVDHAGDVTHLEAHNKGSLPVLLIDGEHLEGAKQNRILNATVLVAANRTSTLPVACVEHGRWSYSAQADFSPSGDHAYSELRSKNAEVRAVNMREMNSRAVDQGQVWDEVGKMHDRLGAMSPTGAMKDSFDHRRGELDAMKRAFAHPGAGQTGVIACIGGRPVALDAFDRPETLSKLWQRLLSGYALDALGRPEQPLADGAIETFLSAAAGAETTSHEGLGVGMDVVLTAPDVVGNALTWEDGVVHLALFARSVNDEPTRQGYRAQRIERPSRRAGRITGTLTRPSRGRHAKRLGRMNKGGFSWKRFLGISAAKSRVSRKIGIPLTRSGRHQKIGRMATGGGCLLPLAGGAMILGLIITRLKRARSPYSGTFFIGFDLK